MTHGPERGDTAEEMFWIQWKGLMNRLTKDEQDLVNEMMKRVREEAWADAENLVRNIRDIK